MITRTPWSTFHWIIFALAVLGAALLLYAFWLSSQSGVRYLPMDEYNAAHTDVDNTELAPAPDAQPAVYTYDRLSGRYVDEHPSGDAAMDAAQRKASEGMRAMYADAAAYTAQHRASIDHMMQTTGASVDHLCNTVGEYWQTMAKARDAGTPMSTAMEKIAGLYGSSSTTTVSMRTTQTLMTEGLVTVFSLYPDQPPAFFRARGIDHCRKLMPAANHREAVNALAHKVLH